MDKRINFLPSTSKKIAVGMSGGVDSSVTALLLKQAGYEVQGIFMKNWEETFSPGYCTAEDDVMDAKDVCETIGISLHTVNFAQAYQDKVFKYFLSEYKAGRTPNPDVLCNREIKFSELLSYAQSLGCEYIATGHYCRKFLNDEDQQSKLIKAVDQNKDQTYFLNAMTQSQLQSAIFPLGEMKKPEIRAIAEHSDLITYDKKDSTGICFIGERNFKTFLSQYLPAQPGKIVTLSGEVIGEHSGLMYYTIGQRQGLGIGGLANYDDSPWFVAKKRLEKNELVVVQAIDESALMSNTLKAGQLNWLRKAPKNHQQLTAKTRYRQTEQNCIVSFNNKNEIIVEFEKPQRAITPGQYAVFYDELECLGGGVIETKWNK